VTGYFTTNDEVARFESLPWAPDEKTAQVAQRQSAKTSLLRLLVSQMPE
jgi:hypothetical protein